MNCPNCAKNLDAHVAIGWDDRLPETGDILICAYCRKPLVVGFAHTLHVMSEEEEALLSDEERADIEFALRLPKPK